MATIVTLETERTDYSPAAAALRSMTVGELISYLEQFDEEDKVIFSNDAGYTYGSIRHYSIGDLEIEEED